ncbi:putative molecular chaperone [Blochmannia endosymbiont of Camponotus (Colobopsis) obliquus]|nr:putative molecular chaperone [Blochmannia endosymbiont of Camponotus (Colobopsis) obliquus]
MKILAFSTSTAMCSVALMVSNDIIEKSVIFPCGHAQKILLMIHRILTQAGITLKKIDVLVFLQGPGSFVGTRIGIGVAQGLSLGFNLPLIGISTLATLAQGAWRRFGVNQVFTAIYACTDKLYFSYYRRKSNGRWLGSNTEMLISIAEINDILFKLKKEGVFVGDGWKNYSMLFSSNSSYIYLDEILYPIARDMIPLALQKWDDGMLCKSDEVRPIYL